MPERKLLVGQRRRDPNRPTTVLVVDDDTNLRWLMRHVLEEDGHTVFEAKDGLDGLEMFRSDPHRFHAVVLDIEMPRMNGIEAFQAIRAIRTDIPVIVVSGSAPEEYRHRLPVADLAAILRKPFKLHELLGVVGRCIPHEGMQPVGLNQP